MTRITALSAIHGLFLFLLVGCAQDDATDAATAVEDESRSQAETAEAASAEDDLAEQVSRMGAVGFSDHGKRPRSL